MADVELKKWVGRTYSRQEGGVLYISCLIINENGGSKTCVEN